MNYQYLQDVRRKIAYFSMEIGILQSIRTFSGGLGILAGDTIRSAADLEVPMVAVTLLYRKGYLHQQLDDSGWQHENPDDWKPEELLTEFPNRISLRVENRYVYVRAWRYDVVGVTGFKVPIFFLDSDLPENSDFDRTLTHNLYGGDQFYRLAQEKILGIGGVRMLRNFGYSDIERYHMNEGHASLLTLELLDQEVTRAGRNHIEPSDVDIVREKCVFTTHTPVAAGHDKFPLDLVDQVLKRKEISTMKDVFGTSDNMLNMTHLAMNLSRYINGVAKKHGEVSRGMFPGYTVHSITNGVHAAYWLSPHIKKMFDDNFHEWQKDNNELRFALKIPREQMWEAHQAAKRDLIRTVKEMTGKDWDENVFTLGSARRATPYKRGDLLFHDTDKLIQIAKKHGKIQAVFAGKAHPKDEGGKSIIQRIHQATGLSDDSLSVVFLADYDIELAKIIIPGVDIWLNTPEPPLEASGTSGMKAAVNGVPSLSILDGWWIEGHVEGITGWAIGEDGHGKPQAPDTERDANSLYSKLENQILPLYYKEKDRYLHVMRNSIALNGSFFNTQRMVQEYVLKAYFC
ncbi:MAG: alpha-glucan family phosphorylase [Candidatus Omnitrophica bacterium]|nr:alpha-glucan family phosphorylase [Candidatus Omnitrophota bacterium]